jgi:hypothetical protein
MCDTCVCCDGIERVHCFDRLRSVHRQRCLLTFDRGSDPHPVERERERDRQTERQTDRKIGTKLSTGLQQIERDIWTYLEIVVVL